MKTDNLHVLLQLLKRDYWLFQVLWMNEKCRGLKEFRASNEWRVNCGCGNLYPVIKVVELMDGEGTFSEPTVVPKNNTTFAEIEQALREWSVWADKQIGEKKITVGTMVNVHDNSNSMMIMDGRVRQEDEAGGYLQNRNPHTILAINGNFPTETTCTKITNNIMIRTSNGVIAFTHTRHVTPVRERLGEKVESDNPHIIKV